MAMVKSRIAHMKSDALMDWLRKLGITPETLQRVIIDIRVGSVVQVYTTGIALDDAFTIEPPPDILGAEIVKVEEN